MRYVIILEEKVLVEESSKHEEIWQTIFSYVPAPYKVSMLVKAKLEEKGKLTADEVKNTKELVELYDNILECCKFSYLYECLENLPKKVYLEHMYEDIENGSFKPSMVMQSEKGPFLDREYEDMEEGIEDEIEDLLYDQYRDHLCLNLDLDMQCDKFQLSCDAPEKVSTFTIIGVESEKDYSSFLYKKIKCLTTDK